MLIQKVTGYCYYYFSYVDPLRCPKEDIYGIY